MKRFAERLSRIQPSATVAISTKARQLAAEGKDILSFSMGEPDFDTPEHIKKGAAQAIVDGATRYTAATGTPELKKAICDAAERRRGVKWTPAECAVSVGAKHVLFNLALCLFEKGDEVVIPAPYWVSYPEQVSLAGAEPVIVETTEESGFKVLPEQLKAALTPATKAVVLCSPSNPTGSAYTEAELRALADVLAEHECWIIVDEIYGELVYEVITTTLTGTNCSDESPLTCTIVIEGGQVEPVNSFRRGDADDSGITNLTDGIFILSWLFRASAAPACQDAADLDDSGDINLTDAIYLLVHLFGTGPAPPAPGMENCGPDGNPADGLAECAAASCQG